jgi:hypothetical protein
MRINNSKIKDKVISGYFVSILITLVLSTVFSVFKGIDLDPVITFIMVIFIFLAVFIAIFNIAKYFEYDSDGLKVGVMNKGLLSTDYLRSKEHTIEFDKENLIRFKFQNFVIYKRLILIILNSRGHNKKEIFNVTLVSRKKRKYVKQSLNKIIRNNRKKTSE